ncbi:hypothetical protein L7F22_030094 [Adiantum nelumboides]|nr:hypothetical protein [Adiantum nelumboides]
MQEAMKAVLLLLPLILQEAFALAAPPTCVFPNFSHNDKNALEWLEKRLSGDSSKSKAVWPQVNWSKHAKRKHQHVVASGNTSWEEFEQYLTWLHKKDGVKLRKFFLKDTKRFKLKNQGVSNGKVYEPMAVASMDLREKEVLLEIPVKIRRLNLVLFYQTSSNHQVTSVLLRIRASECGRCFHHK